MMMNIQQEARDGWCILAVTGRADALTADALETALVGAAKTNPKVAVDLSRLDYISSAGLRSLLQGARAAQESNAEFVLCSPQASTKSVLDISGMQQVIRIEEKLPC
jgi:anti-sigma B factor antagonist